MVPKQPIVPNYLRRYSKADTPSKSWNSSDYYKSLTGDYKKMVDLSFGGLPIFLIVPLKENRDGFYAWRYFFEYLFKKLRNKNGEYVFDRTTVPRKATVAALLYQHDGTLDMRDLENILDKEDKGIKWGYMKVSNGEVIPVKHLNAKIKRHIKYFIINCLKNLSNLPNKDKIVETKEDPIFSMPSKKFKEFKNNIKTFKKQNPKIFITD